MTDDAFDSSLREFRRARRKGRLRVLAIALLSVGLFGLLPLPLGLGVFGWRLFRYEIVDLHFVNVTGETVRLALGSSTDEFPGGRVHSLSFRAGDAELEVYGEDGRLLETAAFYTDNQSVFYNLGEGHCFVLLEASAMYDPGRVGDPIAVVERIYPDDRITLIPAGVFIPPRGVAGDTLPGGQRLFWIDDIACELLDPAEEHVLIGQQIVRMEGRREERRRRLEEARRRQQQE